MVLECIPRIRSPNVLLFGGIKNNELSILGRVEFGRVELCFAWLSYAVLS